MPSDANPLAFFSENVDRWGAAEWFDRLAKAIRAQDNAVVAKNDIAFETYRRIASSSAMALVRDFEPQVRAALAQGAGVAVRELEWEEVTAARSNEDPSREHTGDYEAVSPIGVYYIEMYFASDSYGWRVTLHGSDDVADKDDPEAAKAAAQSDYEQRIRSALVASPPREELERVTRERDAARAELTATEEDRDRIRRERGMYCSALQRAEAKLAEAESQLAEARAQLAALSREGGE